jgi:hypothetical protein
LPLSSMTIKAGKSPDRFHAAPRLAERINFRIQSLGKVARDNPSIKTGRSRRDTSLFRYT